MIGRFFKELFNPKLKCKRVGHKLTTDKNVRIRERSTGWGVVTDYRASIKRCRRCGKTYKPTKKKLITSYSGCSMPSSWYEEMDSNGYIIMQ